LNIRLAIRTFFLLTLGAAAVASDSQEDKAWQDNYDARQRYFEATVGPLPRDILKMLSMGGVWPGGGLFVIPAGKLGPDLSFYTTFGLTNPDMPTTVRMTNFQLDSDGKRATRAEGVLQKKAPAPKSQGAAGYGYEICVVTRKDQQWPLGFLQWSVNAELANDVGFLARVAKYDGLSVEKIDVGKGGPVNVLISKAQAPLPIGTVLPAGKMDLLVAVTITDAEMQWSMQNGRGALLQKLREAGVGQISVLGRPSVVP
jgi:hypothetical protein